MADHLSCSFMDFRSFTAKYYNLHSFLPSKHYSSALVHYHNSRINRRIKRSPLHLNLISKPSSPIPSSSELDVVSIHVKIIYDLYVFWMIVLVEHSDGSVLFRFGDPSEVAKNVEINEPETIKEEIENEVKDEYSLVKVLDGEYESEVMVKKLGREVKVSSSIELVDNTNSVVTSSESVAVVDEENVSSEELFEDSNEIESKEVEITSIPDTGNVEEIVIKENEDSSPQHVSTLDESCEIKNSISIEELPEEEIVDVATLQSISLKPGPVADSEHQNEVTELQTEETELQNELIEDSTNSVFGESLSMAPQLEPATNLSEAVEAQNSMQNVTSGDGSENDENDIVTIGMHTVIIGDGNGSEVNDVVAEAEPSECGTEERDEIVEDGSGSDVIELMPVSPRLEAEPTFDESNIVNTVKESSPPINIVEESQGKDGVESLTMNNQMPPYSISESETTEDVDNVGSRDLIKASVHEVTELKSTESATNSQEVLTTDVVLSSECGTTDGDESVEDGSESDVIELMAVSTRLEAEPALDEDTGNDIVEESTEDDNAESLTMHNEVPQNSILESKKTEDDDNVLSSESSDHVNASIYEVTELESTEFATNSQEVLTTNFVLSSGAAVLPHPSKVLTGGEDAYFVAGQTWLGVADGVGEWSLEGTSPGVYARELMKTCERLISDSNGDSINDPLELLKLSVAETHSPGSSAVLVAQFDGQALHVVNIGDSGFTILRHGTVYKRSSPTVHGFHFPLQIKKGEDPSHLAELYRFDLEEDDVIITATDGVFDNLYDQEISSIVLKSLAADRKLEEIAVILANKAQEIGKSASGRSPFADNAQAAGCAGYTGGKLDDVAVIISVVRKISNSQNL
ncbi:hypothetical protein BUALT_Bualt15G0072200 [Buddleja alternifolia]|uniref:PPM-type phosphatase domain-containing protein n=1 Tax=Buddleja alternifolia TaxID=168488 RepID=A0AAV6WP74_9LAMI|nr:hypothetical protein BUALT_Bualt15G0072200 [Buddleja alternifolia]